MYISKQESTSFVIHFTGGSVKIYEKSSSILLATFKGLHYVYTGCIRPDEKQCFALENGKHFYVISLGSMELMKRITLPKGFESIDAVGYYSSDGTTINIPASRYVTDSSSSTGGYYERILCKYNSESLELLKIKPVKYELLQKKLWPGSLIGWLGGAPTPGNDKEI